MNDSVDAIMSVMETAFDSAYGEAWKRHQVMDALLMPNTFFLISGPDGGEVVDPDSATGFCMSRQAADEEELLLIAVRPELRGAGIGARLMERFIAAAHARGSCKLFLEMRDGNPAEFLYRKFGFERVGVRRGYYRGAVGGPLDAITFARHG